MHKFSQQKNEMLQDLQKQQKQLQSQNERAKFREKERQIGQLEQIEKQLQKMPTYLPQHYIPTEEDEPDFKTCDKVTEDLMRHFSNADQTGEGEQEGSQEEPTLRPPEQQWIQLKVTQPINPEMFGRTSIGEDATFDSAYLQKVIKNSSQVSLDKSDQENTQKHINYLDLLDKKFNKRASKTVKNTSSDVQT